MSVDDMALKVTPHRPCLLEDGLERVASILELRDLAVLGACCRAWHKLFDSSDFVWREQWLRRLGGYAYLPRFLSEMEASPKETLKAAVLDEKRTELTFEELTDLEWRFRFKRAAGQSWMAVDPYWCDRPATRVTFHPDGTTSRTGFLTHGAAVDDDSSSRSDFRITWRWGNSTSSAPASGKAPCDRVRANVDGQDVPTYVASRHPVHKGFVMQSCWALYTAFPMPGPGQDPFLDDEALEVGFEQQAREALEYNRSQRLAGLDGLFLGNAGYVDLDAFDAILRGDHDILAAIVNSTSNILQQHGQPAQSSSSSSSHLEDEEDDDSEDDDGADSEAKEDDVGEATSTTTTTSNDSR
mmetsp:Transcript_19661/g.60811  ORF Transcript_19661/g.60811 Transcript_19661/m.60811 type:complete len:355 (+) Transcript_19661:62-1126(+)